MAAKIFCVVYLVYPTIPDYIVESDLWIEKFVFVMKKNVEKAAQAASEPMKAEMPRKGIKHMTGISGFFFVRKESTTTKGRFSSQVGRLKGIGSL